MINSVNANTSVYSPQTGSAAYQSAVAPSRSDAPEKDTDAVVVELSDNAKKAKKLLGDLPPLILNQTANLEKAETHLKELMKALGIPENTKIDIQSDNAGNFAVTGDHPLVTEIEKQINDGTDRELRNALVGAHTGAVLERIGAATEMAMKGADENPRMTDTYYGWILTVAKSAQSMDYSVSLDQGTISGTLVNSSGKAVASYDGLRLPQG